MRPSGCFLFKKIYSYSEGGAKGHLTDKWQNYLSHVVGVTLYLSVSSKGRDLHSDQAAASVPIQAQAHDRAPNGLVDSLFPRDL